MKIWMKRWKWYLISGASVLVALLIFAVIVYINMTPTLGKDATNADKIFDFLDKWASAGAPAMTLLAVAAALGIGVASILQTRNIQQSERKQRLVKEIEEWAKELVRFIDEYERGDGTRSLWHFIKWRWQILKATKANMQETAHKIDKDFGNKVENAVTAFDTLDMNIDKGMISNISNDLERCKKSCDEILQLAGSLKFKEIG